MYKSISKLEFKKHCDTGKIKEFPYGFLVVENKKGYCSLFKFQYQNCEYPIFKIIPISSKLKIDDMKKYIISFIKKDRQGV